MISLVNALEIAIKDLRKPIISRFEIFYLALCISKSDFYSGQRIRAQRKVFDIEKNKNLIMKLRGFLFLDSDFKHHYRIVTEPYGFCDEVCCLVDPFCYVSHLSAMQKYGLTDRIPEVLILTTPEPRLWNQLKTKLENKYKSNFPDEKDYPHIKKAVFPKMVRNMKIKLIESKLIHPSLQIRDSHARISEIGHTFLDMLINPDLCGGMSHVIEVWRKNAKTYLDEVIEAINSDPRGIIKCRAGYIIEEILAIRDERVNAWSKFAQRGGSRILDPNSLYSSKFSEKWMISINV